MRRRDYDRLNGLALLREMKVEEYILNVLELHLVEIRERYLPPPALSDTDN